MVRPEPSYGTFGRLCGSKLLPMDAQICATNSTHFLAKFTEKLQYRLSAVIRTLRTMSLHRDSTRTRKGHEFNAGHVLKGKQDRISREPGLAMFMQLVCVVEIIWSTV